MMRYFFEEDSSAVLDMVSGSYLFFKSVKAAFEFALKENARFEETQDAEMEFA